MKKDFLIVMIAFLFVSLYAFEPEVLWKFQTGSYIYSSPAVADIDGDGKLEIVFGSRDDRLYAINGEDGTELWKFQTGYDIYSSPAVADIDGDGKLEIVFGSEDNRLYALKTPGTSKSFSLKFKGDNWNTGNMDNQNIFNAFSLNSMVGEFDYYAFFPEYFEEDYLELSDYIFKVKIDNIPPKILAPDTMTLNSTVSTLVAIVIDEFMIRQINMVASPFKVEFEPKISRMKADIEINIEKLVSNQLVIEAIDNNENEANKSIRLRFLIPAFVGVNDSKVFNLEGSETILASGTEIVIEDINDEQNYIISAYGSKYLIERDKVVWTRPDIRKPEIIETSSKRHGNSILLNFKAWDDIKFKEVMVNGTKVEFETVSMDENEGHIVSFSYRLLKSYTGNEITVLLIDWFGRRKQVNVPLKGG